MGQLQDTEAAVVLPGMWPEAFWAWKHRHLGMGEREIRDQRVKLDNRKDL